MLLRRDRAGKLCELSAVFLALIWKVRGNPGSEKNKMTFNACKALHPGGKVFFFFQGSGLVLMGLQMCPGLTNRSSGICLVLRNKQASKEPRSPLGGNKDFIKQNKIKTGPPL